MSDSRPFLYFVPGNVTLASAIDNGHVRAEFLAEHGLAEVLADVEKDVRDVVVTLVDRGGPAGDPGGVVLCPMPGDGELPDDVQYFPDRQEWMRVETAPEQPELWIGWTKGKPPRPSDLQRREQLQGNLARDSFDRWWRVPVARSPEKETGTLPCAIVKDGEGQVVRRVQPHHAWLWELGLAVNDYYQFAAKTLKAGKIANDDKRESAFAKLVNHPGNKSDEWLFERAVEILGANYRIGWAEINAFAKAGCAVLDDRSIYAIASSLVDAHKWKEFSAKKNEAGSSA